MNVDIVDSIAWISPAGRPFAKLALATFFAMVRPTDESARPGDIMQFNFDVKGRQYIALFNPTAKSRRHLRITRNGRTVPRETFIRIITDARVASERVFSNAAVAAFNEAFAADDDSCTEFVRDAVRLARTVTPREFMGGILRHASWMSAKEKRLICKNAHDLDKWWSAIASLPYSTAACRSTTNVTQATA